MQAILDLIGRRCCAGAVEFVAPDGRRWRLGGGSPVAVRVRDASVLWRMLRNPRLAFAEAYMDGHWEPLNGNLAEVLRVCVSNLDGLAGPAAARWYNKLRAQLGELNTRRRALANVHHH